MRKVMFALIAAVAMAGTIERVDAARQAQQDLEMRRGTQFTARVPAHGAVLVKVGRSE